MQSEPITLHAGIRRDSTGNDFVYFQGLVVGGERNGYSLLDSVYPAFASSVTKECHVPKKYNPAHLRIIHIQWNLLQPNDTPADRNFCIFSLNVEGKTTNAAMMEIDPVSGQLQSSDGQVVENTDSIKTTVGSVFKLRREVSATMFRRHLHWCAVHALKTARKKRTGYRAERLTDAVIESVAAKMVERVFRVFSSVFEDQFVTEEESFDTELHSPLVHQKPRKTRKEKKSPGVKPKKTLKSLDELPAL